MECSISRTSQAAAFLSTSQRIYAPFTYHWSGHTTACVAPTAANDPTAGAPTDNSITAYADYQPTLKSAPCSPSVITIRMGARSTEVQRSRMGPGEPSANANTATGEPSQQLRSLTSNGTPTYSAAADNTTFPFEVAATDTRPVTGGVLRISNASTPRQDPVAPTAIGFLPDGS